MRAAASALVKAARGLRLGERLALRGVPPAAAPPHSRSQTRGVAVGHVHAQQVKQAGILPAEFLDAELLRHFGVRTGLYPYQAAAIRAVREGRSCLVVQGTASGKSICYQLPPLLPGASGKIAVVISPLISLMQDQTAQLAARGIPAVFLGSAQPDIDAWAKVEAGEYRVVYMSPEFASARWSAVAGLRDRMALLAVDEAHCVSSWGHDFRPHYREVARLVARHLPGVPKLALTATCTTHVQSDLQELFGVDELLRDTESVPGNLRLKVLPRTTKDKDLVPLLALPTHPGVDAADARKACVIDNSKVTPYSSTLIYVQTKAAADELTEWLCARGVRCGAYHAGLKLQGRREAHERFFNGDLQVLCCTVAYGMGISKCNIRRIVHYGSPGTMEHYVQQVGRAGRDGDVAECLCFVSAADEGRNRRILLHGATEAPCDYKEQLVTMTAHFSEFLQSSVCRRAAIGRYFNAPSVLPVAAPSAAETTTARAPCGMCDRCDEQRSASAPVRNVAELTDEARLFLEILVHVQQDLQAPTGYSLPCLVAIGSRAKQARRFEQYELYGAGKGRSQLFWRELAKLLRAEGLLTEKLESFSGSAGHFAAIATSEQGNRFLADKTGTFRPECSSETMHPKPLVVAMGLRRGAARARA